MFWAIVALESVVYCQNVPEYLIWGRQHFAPIACLDRLFAARDQYEDKVEADSTVAMADQTLQMNSIAMEQTLGCRQTVVFLHFPTKAAEIPGFHNYQIIDMVALINNTNLRALVNKVRSLNF